MFLVDGIQIINEKSLIQRSSCNEDTWQLRIIKNHHTYSREFNINIMNSSGLSKKFHSKLKETPKIKLKDLMNMAQTKWNTKLTKT